MTAIAQDELRLTNLLAFFAATAARQKRIPCLLVRHVSTADTGRGEVSSTETWSRQGSYLLRRGRSLGG